MRLRRPYAAFDSIRFPRNRSSTPTSPTSRRARFDDLCVAFAGRRGDAREMRVRVQVDVIQSEVAVVVENQAPLTVGGDAPAQIRIYRYALGDGALHLAQVAFDVVFAADVVRGRNASVLDQHDRFSGKLPHLLDENIVEDLGPNRCVPVDGVGGRSQALELRWEQRR